jgi:hypothetical protein
VQKGAEFLLVWQELAAFAAHTRPTFKQDFWKQTGQPGVVSLSLPLLSDVCFESPAYLMTGIPAACPILKTKHITISVFD